MKFIRKFFGKKPKKKPLPYIEIPNPQLFAEFVKDNLVNWYKIKYKSKFTSKLNSDFIYKKKGFIEIYNLLKTSYAKQKSRSRKALFSFIVNRSLINNVFLSVEAINIINNKINKMSVDKAKTLDKLISLGELPILGKTARSKKNPKFNYFKLIHSFFTNKVFEEKLLYSTIRLIKMFPIEIENFDNRLHQVKMLDNLDDLLHHLTIPGFNEKQKSEVLRLLYDKSFKIKNMKYKAELFSEMLEYTHQKVKDFSEKIAVVDEYYSDERLSPAEHKYEITRLHNYRPTFLKELTNAINKGKWMVKE